MIDNGGEKSSSPNHSQREVDYSNDIKSNEKNRSFYHLFFHTKIRKKIKKQMICLILNNLQIALFHL